MNDSSLVFVFRERTLTLKNGEYFESKIASLVHIFVNECKLTRLNTNMKIQREHEQFFPTAGLWMMRSFLDFPALEI